MKTGKLYGVGIGPGDPQYLTLRAADVLRSVDVVFTVISPNASNSVSQSVVDYLQPRGEVRLQVFSMSRDKTIREEQVRANAEAIIAELRAGHDCAFATLGDAMTYSTFGYVLEIIRKAIPNLASGSHPRHHLIRHAHRQGGNRARRERRTAQDYSVVPRRNG